MEIVTELTCEIFYIANKKNTSAFEAIVCKLEDYLNVVKGFLPVI